MVDQNVTAEVANAIGTMGTPAAAVLAAAWLARELRSVTDKLVSTMGDTIKRNTEAMAKVESAITACQLRGSDTQHTRRKEE